MKSNDNIPEDELILAELIAAARGCKGARFRDKRFQRVYFDRDIPDVFERKPVACCALGAELISFLKPQLSIAAAVGNDAASSETIGYTDRAERRDWNIGAAFNQAMTKG